MVPNLTRGLRLPTQKTNTCGWKREPKLLGWLWWFCWWKNRKRRIPKPCVKRTRLASTSRVQNTDEPSIPWSTEASSIGREASLRCERVCAIGACQERSGRGKKLLRFACKGRVSGVERAFLSRWGGLAVKSLSDQVQHCCGGRISTCKSIPPPFKLEGRRCASSSHQIRGSGRDPGV